MKHSLRLKITSIFVGIMALTLIGLWVLNNCFLEDFYCRNKVKIFDEAYLKLNQMVSQGNDSSIDFEMNQWRESQNMSVLVVQGSEWTNIYKVQMTSPYERERMMQRLQQDVINSNQDNVQVIEKRDSYTIQKVFDDNTQTHYMECFGFIPVIEWNSSGLFLMSIPLSTIQDSVKLANEFLINIGIVALVISTVAMYMAVWSLTKPILVLSHISERMTALDFSAKYEGNDNNEIGILGNSMNAMSEKLERTIRELQSANAQLKKDIEEKIQIDDMRKEFLSNVSHELKTPIALIQGYAEGL